MAQILDLYAFIAVLLRGINLALEAITVGGVIFLALCLSKDSPLQRPCRRTLRISSALLALGALLSASLAALVLHSSATDYTWLDVMNAGFAWSGLLLAAGAILLSIGAASWPATWLTAPAIVIVGSSLLGAHAVGRVDNRPLLLTITALHRLATDTWIGGLPYLLLTVARGEREAALAVARRFSRLAGASVGFLFLAGLLLGQQYIGSVPAFYGTAYGWMLGAKILLFVLLLLLGGSNFLLLRRPAILDSASLLRLRRVVEVEVAVGIAAILAAASLTSQPPAVDLTTDRVSGQEIIDRIAPHPPRLTTPPLASLSPATPLDSDQNRFSVPLSYMPGTTSYKPSTKADIEWSEFNHNWAGICVLAMGILAMLAQTKRARWATHWPLAFLGLALFLLVRADAENWPLGPRGFWESFQVAEVAQHRLFVVLIVFAAFFEWRVARGINSKKWNPLVFPAVCMVGGALLLTHTHPLGNIREELLIEISHTLIAVVAVTAAAARWLELRLPKRLPALAFVWTACLVMIGLTLTFYRES